MPTIKSSTDLRNNYNDISTFCHDTNEPVFITKNGQGDLAVMSIDKYEELTSERIEASKRELYALLAVGRADRLAGRGKPVDEARRDFYERIGVSVSANGKV